MKRVEGSVVKRWVAVLAAVMVVCIVGTAFALVRPPLRAAIMLRAAGYEHHFAGRKGEAVLAIVSSTSGTASKDGEAMNQVLRDMLAQTKVAGRRVRVVTIAHANAEATNSSLQDAKAELVYVAQGLEALLPHVPKQVDGIRRIVFCADGAQVGSGCTLGVELAQEKPRIVIDLEQTNSVGLRFDLRLLKIARIVR